MFPMPISHPSQTVELEHYSIIGKQLVSKVNLKGYLQVYMYHHNLQEATILY